MKHVYLFAAFFLVLKLSSIAQLDTYIDSIIEANFDENGPGGVMLLARDGEPVYKRAFGYANLELGVPNKTDMVYRIGSISKQFTAVAILQLAQEGKLNLDDDIRTYLPEYNTFGREITIRHILSHTSGIPSYTESPDFAENMFIDQSKQEIVEFFMDDSLLFEPGMDWSYSNSGYVLAGLIVESITDMDYNDYIQKNIFDPLEMTSTYFGSYDMVIPNAASGYASAGGDEYRPATYLSWTWPYAAGAIISTVDDMLKWDNALYTDLLVDRKWKAEAWAPYILADGRSANYGLGWGVSTYNGTRIIAHGGGINGFVCMGIRIPDERIYALMLTNSTTVSPTALVEKIALKAAGLGLPKPIPLDKSDTNLGDYMGAYQIHTQGGRIVSNYSSDPYYRYITLEDDTLRSQPSGEGKTALIEAGEDLFFFDEDDVTYLQFLRDGNNKVAALNIYIEPTKFGPDEYEPKRDVPMLDEKVEIEVAEEILKKYEGKYDFGGGFFMEVVVEGNELFIIPTAQPKQKAFADSENSFFFKDIDASMKFGMDETGIVTKMIFTQGATYEAQKME